MELVFAVVAGGLYATSLYMLMRRSIVKLIVGVALLTHATNLVVFTAGGLVRARPPLIEEGAERITGPVADPLPQALLLTAIVISFGLLAFTLVLVDRVYRTSGTDDLADLSSTDK